MWNFLHAGLGVLAFLASLASTVHLLLHYRRPSTALGWLFAVWALPVLGALAYVCLSVYEGPRKVRRGRRRAAELRRQRARVDDGVEELDTLESPHFRAVSERVCPFPMLSGNLLQPEEDADRAQERQFAEMREARRRIWLQTYIMEEDEVTRPLLELLGQRAQDGLDVRIMIDPIGSVSFPSKTVRRLREQGVRCEAFLRPSPLKRRFQLNFRNHRKLLVIDQVVWTGGRNTSRDYYGPDACRDMMLRVEGPVAGQLMRVYLEDWAIASASELENLEEDIPRQEPGPQVHPARALPHGCDEEGESVPTLLGAALRAATESILVVTPYFVPGRKMLDSLRLAALGGIRVQILMPERSPERTPQWAARRFFQPILEAGGEIWLRRPPFLHAKVIIVDERWSTLGSLNFDHRSLFLNYELNVEVPGRAFAKELRERLQADFDAARRVSWEEYRERSMWRTVQENTAALFEPIL